jgi:high-affinity iron transporter
MSPVALLFVGSIAYADDPDRGEAIYLANCLACHGAALDGRGPAASALKPPPPDLTRPEWWAGRDAAALKRAIKLGSPGTSMLAFSYLSNDELDAVVAFLDARRPAAPAPGAAP